jgi:hypothetical protein
MIKLTVDITSSKILAVVITAAGIVLALLLDDAMAWEVACASAAALMTGKNVTESYTRTRSYKYKQEPKETID